MELALAVEAYVFLKPLIGYWCFVPHTPARIALYVVVVVAFANSLWTTRREWFRAPTSSADVAPPETGGPQDE
jgi:hypothetical protein